MPFFDDVTKPVDLEADLPEVIVPPAWSWQPLRLWTCPGCSSTTLTREASQRCGRCGFRDGT